MNYLEIIDNLTAVALDDEERQKLKNYRRILKEKFEVADTKEDRQKAFVSVIRAYFWWDLYPNILKDKTYVTEKYVDKKGQEKIKKTGIWEATSFEKYLIGLNKILKQRGGILTFPEKAAEAV